MKMGVNGARSGPIAVLRLFLLRREITKNESVVLSKVYLEWFLPRSC
jgi:hypothetical protein